MKALLLVATALIAMPVAAQTIAITGGTVVIGDATPPAPGTVLIRDGRIVAAGPNVTVPSDAQRIDATGKWVSPGLVAGFTRLGLVEVDAVDPTNDSAGGGSPFNASIDVADGINSRATPIAINRARGITRAIVAPESAGNLFAGQGAVIDTGSDPDSITRARAFQFVELGEQGAQVSGGSRPAAYAMLRNMLSDARDYARNPSAFMAQGRDAMLQRRDASALLDVINGRTPLLIHAESGPDILRIIALKKDFPNTRFVIVGGVEGWTVARQLAASGIPVIASALNDLPDQFERLAATQSNIGRMQKAGINVSLGTIDDDDPRMAIRTTQYAGNLVALNRVPGATGLDWTSAFSAITMKPAEAIGMADEIGSLRPGRRADVVMWSGDPLELSSAPERMWIDGAQQDLTTRQTRLRDRYATPQDGALPKAYDR